jgi:hypothetical protein
LSKKRLVAVAAVLVVIVIVVSSVIFLNSPAPPKGPLFTVTGKQQTTQSVSGYNVVSWNFTFAYRGDTPLQNVNLFLDNGDTPFKTVSEVTTNWVYEYIWTPEDLTANRTITISWQGGTESYEFQP